MDNLSTLQISSLHPCLVIYMLDQSGSMDEMFDNAQRKDKKLADSINEIIYETGVKCYDGSGEIKNRFELSVVGYGASDGGKHGIVAPAWEGALKDRWVVPIAEVFPNAIGEENEIPIWITPKAEVDTPMTRAFREVYKVCDAWINWGNHRECHPPIVINITDGLPTDSGTNDMELKNIVNQLKSLNTNYGNVNIFNIHISSFGGDSILFPTKSPYNKYSQLLFELSTPLNSHMINLARNNGYNLEEGCKGFIYNGTGKHLMDFLNIGSNPLNTSHES